MKKYNNIYRKSLTLLSCMALAFLSVGCEDFTDGVNVDPNEFSEGPKLTLATSLINTGL